MSIEERLSHKNANLASRMCLLFVRIHHHPVHKMGALWSRCTRPDPQLPTSTPPASTATRIIALQLISLKLEQSKTDVWIYQSHINALPISSGQNIAIYRQGEDVSRPGCQPGEIVEGRIGGIENCNGNYVIFQIHNSTAGVPTFIIVPVKDANTTLYERIIGRLTHNWGPRRLTKSLPPVTPTIQTH